MSLNPYQQMKAENDALREQNAHLRRVVNSFDGRVSALESRDSEQQTWNVEAQKRVNKLEGGNSLCPGCFQPQGEGVHGVFCFQVADNA